MMVWDGNMGVWGYILMVASFVLFWGAIITALVLFARSTGAGNRRYDSSGTGTAGTWQAEHMLAERFARGEIDETEYVARLNVLRRRA
ncbi:SHOCT domain-containing protein [Pseudarthrobacter defluvii]|jgi:putative membrane protein|uniref:SHOCT domain-containing protein n=1 Tax=Pseudarthrobacter defluvii TaxID=410837 RepID=UPI00257899B0|nr:hypothetical protein [Pseudarthrobacter defluvii]WJH26722.1 hypothetical protein JCQ34_19850 [Pseudarthrobacter defluvii]